LIVYLPPHEISLNPLCEFPAAFAAGFFVVAETAKLITEKQK
jgi:hypothetical protein